MKTLMRVISYVLMFLLLPVIGYHVGYQALHYPASLPKGEWQKQASGYHYRFYRYGVESWPTSILYVEDGKTIYFSVGGYDWVCDLKPAECSKTEFIGLPIENGVYGVTHDVSISEVPPLPKGEVCDILKISIYGGEYVVRDYYLLLDYDEIWYWSSFDGTNSIIIGIGSIVTGICGGGLGIATAIAITVTSGKKSSRKRQNDLAQTLV
jgi:hypothetical protein